MNLARHIPLWLLLTLTALSCSPRTGNSQPVPVATDGPEVPAYADQEDVVRHLGYTASYNHQTLCPNWVAWELTAEEAAGRFNQPRRFSRDPDVAFPKASREDYSSSGWDKGHMAPHADMKWSLQALTESDYFTNICPQDKTMNGGAWQEIEKLTRSMARRYGKVWVVCGPVFDSLPHRHIGPACVHVPDRFFKALVVQQDSVCHAVGFLMDNTPQNSSPT